MNIISNTGPEPDKQTQDTPVRKRELAELEQIVERGKTSFLEVAEALMEIRDRELYLPQTWGEYVKKKFSFSRQYAHRLIQAKQLSDASTMVDKPRNEHHALTIKLKEKRSKLMPPCLSSEFRKFEKLMTSWRQLDQSELIKLLREIEKTVQGILNPQTKKEAA